MAQTPNSEARAGLKLISPTALYVILLLAVPLATVLVYSVMTGARGSVSLPITAENYAELWSRPVYGYIMFKSLMVALVVTFATVLLAYPVAYFVSFHVKPERKSLWLFLITIPFWTSYIIRVSLWFVILGFGGVLDSALAAIGLEPLNVASYSILSIIIVLAHAYAPFAVLPIFVSLEKVDRSLLEAGQDLGESRWVTFLRVTLPLSMPGVIAAALIVFIPTVGDYVTPELVGDGKEPMIANLIETQLLKLNNFAQGSAFAVASMLMVGIVSVVFVLLNRRFIGGQK
ncbi:ABC transporter permease [Tabrizicola piscis]|uniref:ABC transporter permease n=1 Tax=Tabrizicola piscis TaxID=2494374 RepID=A0A3S8U2A5_9RHOB|nr:ABC transporter permease [Tabrizicola piscis]AZL57706.1 ABC transporter permease [Tabrizicola piscis]